MSVCEVMFDITDSDADFRYRIVKNEFGIYVNYVFFFSESEYFPVSETPVVRRIF
jgi:hypothetical protein